MLQPENQFKAQHRFFNLSKEFSEFFCCSCVRAQKNFQDDAFQTFRATKFLHKIYGLG